MESPHQAAVLGFILAYWGHYSNTSTKCNLIVKGRTYLTVVMKFLSKCQALVTKIKSNCEPGPIFLVGNLTCRIYRLLSIPLFVRENFC